MRTFLVRTLLIQAVLITAFFPVNYVRAETRLEAVDTAIACHDQTVFLKVWEAQGLISRIEYNGPNARMIVFQKPWLKSRQDLRERIALAAYCRIATKADKGALKVSSDGGSVYGSVNDGRWRDALAGR